jgi:hypothetical protein
MITVDGYTKDPNIKPEAIVVTFGRDMILDKGGLRPFIRWFEECMASDDRFFLHKCKSKPKHEDLLYVYIIICNRVYYRCYYGGHSHGDTNVELVPGSGTEVINWPRIILAGPVIKTKQKIVRGGFRGFRYATKLF